MLIKIIKGFDERLDPNTTLYHAPCDEADLDDAVAERAIEMGCAIALDEGDADDVELSDHED